MGKVLTTWIYIGARKNFEVAESEFSHATSTFFDLFRFLAAVLVVMEHLSSRLYVGYGDLGSHGYGTKFLYLINLLGSPSVILFFVLSGLFISRNIYKSYWAGRWDWRRYTIARLSRLWIVVLPALVLTVSMDVIAASNGWVNRADGWRVLIGNALFVQTILVPQAGSNGPLWSISNEFWYYFIFPILAFVLCSSRWRYIAPSGIVVICLLFFIGSLKSIYFILWLLGALVLLLPRPRRSRPIVLIISVLCLGAAFVARPLAATGRLFSEHAELALFWPDLAVALTMFATIRYGWSVFSARECLIGARVDGWIRVGASFSFSLYAIHYPIINAAYFIATTSHGFSGLEPGVVSVGIEIFALVVLCAIAWMFATVTEHRTDKLRALFESLVFDRRDQRAKKAQ